MTLAELAPHVYLLELRGAFLVNSLLVVGDDAVAVVDTGTTEADARAILDAVASVSDRPVRYMINSHHHGDHSFGNWWFLPAVVVGHSRCRLRLVGDAGMSHREAFRQMMPMLREQLADLPVVAPELTFERSMALHLGTTTLRLDFLGRAHTNNDIAVTLPERDLCFLGDLIEESAPPVAIEAFTAEWGPTLRHAAELPASTFVPGHGRRGGRAFVEAQALAFEEVSAACAGASTPAEAVAASSDHARAVLGPQLETAVRRYYATVESEVR